MRTLRKLPAAVGVFRHARRVSNTDCPWNAGGALGRSWCTCSRNDALAESGRVSPRSSFEDQFCLAVSAPPGVDHSDSHRSADPEKNRQALADRTTAIGDSLPGQTATCGLRPRRGLSPCGSLSTKRTGADMRSSTRGSRGDRIVGERLPPPLMTFAAARRFSGFPTRR